MKARRRPSLLRDRPIAHRALLVLAVPFVYGIVCGLVLHSSRGVYGLLALLGVIGAFLAGLEHLVGREATLRGGLAGLCFALGVFAGRAVAGGGNHPQPSPALAFVLVAIVVTAIAVALGTRLLAPRRGADAAG